MSRYTPVPDTIRPLRPRVIGGRRYFDAWTTPERSLVSTRECEHCDGERSRFVRIDGSRGYVCPDCDSSLDEMFDEEPPALKKASVL